MDRPILSPYGAVAFFNRELGRAAEERTARNRRTSARHARLIKASDRINDLEEDIAQAAILIRSLIDTALTQGLLTKDELIQIARNLDLRDGRIDGKLDPVGFRPQTEPEALMTPELALRRLAAEE